MKKVLDVGQCKLDHPQIKKMIESNFIATVDLAHTAQEAVQLATSNAYDLIMVNRLLDMDRSSGIALIEAFKQVQAISSVPVMLISNYVDAQNEAIAAGGVAGFGKNALNDPKTIELISTYVGQ